MQYDPDYLCLGKYRPFKYYLGNTVTPCRNRANSPYLQRTKDLALRKNKAPNLENKVMYQLQTILVTTLSIMLRV